MRILLLLSESWNDIQAPNNNMTNWFTDFPDVEIWTISGSSQLPHNNCCKHYFMLDENAMMKSILNGKKVGKALHCDGYPKNAVIASSVNKSKKLFSNELVRLARDFVWRYGKYDIDALKKFIDECAPDIIFSQRYGSVKMCQMEKLVTSITNAPIVAYTGDDEYSLQHFSFSPFFWIRRFWVRRALSKCVPKYKILYSQSERQMNEYEKKFGVKTKFLVKCGSFEKQKVHTDLHKEIKIVYAGKLYCNRWKTLAMLAKAIKLINEKHNEVIFSLNIYTRDLITKKQNFLLNDGVNSIIHGAVSADMIPELYKNADIALHVESFDIKNKLLTKDSFSTKAIDCLSSGCTTMVISWEQHAAYQYFKKQDAAIVAASYDEIVDNLEKITENPSLVINYCEKAFELGVAKHQREVIQKQLRNDFDKVVS